MPLELFVHPFSSYSQKVLMALWERDIAFTYRHLEEAGAHGEMAALWPMRRFPVLVDGATIVAESSVIIEYLDLTQRHAPRLIPADPMAALEVRLLDRFFDTDVMNVMQRPVAEALRPDPSRLDETRARAAAALDIAYAWLEARLAGRTWAAGEDFSMADCAAAPSLFYADWVHPIAPAFAWLREYRARLIARPCFSRAVEEGRPYRHYFPLGAPDRD